MRKLLDDLTTALRPLLNMWLGIVAGLALMGLGAILSLKGGSRVDGPPTNPIEAVQHDG